jgi:hypothetical protein
MKSIRQTCVKEEKNRHIVHNSLGAFKLFAW